MITDEEIEKIFEWADDKGIIGRGYDRYKWKINKDNEKIRRGIPRDKELFLKLTHLNLTGYGFGATKKYEIKYIPSELCKLTNLKWLNLSKNSLNKLPENFSYLCNLEYLNLSQNYLENISQIKNKKLQYLDLHSNKLEKLPKSFGELKNLKELDLSDNENLENIDILNDLNLIKLDIRNIKNKEALRNFTSQTLKQLAVDNKTFIPKYIAKKCPKIGLIEIVDNEDRKDDIEEMDFYKVSYDTGVLVRIPNIEKEALPQIEKPQKPFKNFLYKGE